MRAENLDDDAEITIAARIKHILSCAATAHPPTPPNPSGGQHFISQVT